MVLRGMLSPTESMDLSMAQLVSSPRQPTSPVLLMSTPRTGSAFWRRLKENCEALMPT